MGIPMLLYGKGGFEMKITSTDIINALQAQYTTPEWYLGTEVGNSTGSDCRRHADAIAINAYPSKGFEVRGFEVKVSASDLKSELDNGLKSDEIARFCDYWFLVVPKGLTDNFTLPPTWGVIEYFEGKLKQKVKATKLDKIKPNFGFLCAMLRGRERNFNIEINKRAEEMAKQKQANLNYEATKNKEDLLELQSKLADIKQATGIDLSSWTPSKNIISKLNAAQNIDVITKEVKQIQWQTKRLLESAAEIDKASKAMTELPEVTE